MAIESDLAAVPSLPPRITTALYVIAREGLQNIRKHARATHVTLSLSCDAESDTNRRRVRLAVVDDGIGFDPETVQAPDRYGLTMMDEQATMAGGSVAVTSRPGAGTTVEVVVPFPEQG
jgi:two-component system NarL family sensor kinase